MLDPTFLDENAVNRHERIIARLAVNGITVENSRVIAPSLENIFISLLSRGKAA